MSGSLQLSPPDGTSRQFGSWVGGFAVYTGLGFLDAFSWPWASSPISLALFKIPTGLFGRKKKKYTDQLESHEYGTQKRCEELKFLIQTGQLYRWWLQRG